MDDNLFGVFFKVGFDPALKKDDFTRLADVFRPYIWGENGISNVLKKLKREDYGNDLKLAILQFYIKPSPIELQKLKEIESYRKSEKSIGIPIVVTDDNFFSKSEEGRYNFLKQAILQKLDLLTEVIIRRKLDTKIEQLKSDLRETLN